MKRVKPINALTEWEKRIVKGMKHYRGSGDANAKNKRSHVSYIPLDHFSFQEIVRVQRENEREKPKSELHTRWPAVIQQSLKT